MIRSPVQPLGDLEVVEELGPVAGVGDIVEDHPLQGEEDVVGIHALALVGAGALEHQLHRPAEVALAQALLAEAPGDVVILVQRVDDLRQRLQALLPRHLAGGELHRLDRGQLLRTRQAGQDGRHRGGVVEVRSWCMTLPVRVVLDSLPMA